MAAGMIPDVGIIRAETQGFGRPDYFVPVLPEAAVQFGRDILIH